MAQVETARLSDLKIKKAMIMAYGLPGTGKTEALQWFPRPFVIDIDNGLATLATLPEPRRSPNLKDLQIFPPPGFLQPGVSLSYDQIMVVLQAAAARPYEFGDTIVIDSLSRLEQQMLSQ